MRHLPLITAGAVALATLTAVGAIAPAAHAAPGDTAYALSGTNLLSFDITTPGSVTTRALTGVAAGESLVGLDVRPQNGQLYALGVNAAANTATLYMVHEQTGVVGAIGATGGVAMTNGVNPIDLPDPAAVGYGFDINPAADRVRVTAGSLNFRINPNTGAPVDGDNTGSTSGVVSGANPDGPTNGLTTTVDGAAYTNNVPSNGNIATLYSLDGASNSLYIQNPPNNGSQTSATVVTLGGSPLDFTAANGFDIAAGVNASASDLPVTSGVAYAALTVAGTTKLYTIDLVTGAATLLGAIGTGTLPVQGLALQRDADEGYPAVGLSANGLNLVRFSTATPGTTAAIEIMGVSGSEKLAALAWRPLTGQLLGLGVNHASDTASLYVIDPQSGAASVIGSVGLLAWVESDGTTPFDLPNPTVRPYAMDVNPQVDRVRIAAGADLNARANPISGAAVDGNTSVTGTNPDGATGRALSAVAYTNGYGGAATTTLFALSAGPDELLTVNPPNNGSLTNALPVTLGGQPLDFAALAGLDIPDDLPGTAYAALTIGGQTGLYRIDLATGAATAVGSLLIPVRSLALGSAGANRPVVAPPTTTPPTTPPTTAPPATLTTVGKAVQRKKVIDTGRSLVCPPAHATATCTTKLKVTASYKVMGKKKPKTVVIATRTVSTAKGGSTRLKVTLSKAGVKLLKQRKALTAKVAITAPTGAAAAPATTTLRVKLSRKRL